MKDQDPKAEEGKERIRTPEQVRNEHIESLISSFKLEFLSCTREQANHYMSTEEIVDYFSGVMHVNSDELITILRKRGYEFGPVGKGSSRIMRWYLYKR